MTKPKPKVLHVIVTPELHKRLDQAKHLAACTIQLDMSMSDVVRWLLAKGLDSVEAKR
jgi:hypothetical protein